MGLFNIFKEKKNKVTDITDDSATSFRSDKAEWQWHSAEKYYCEQFNKSPDRLTEGDKTIIWGFAGNHIAFFLTWLIRHDSLGEIHLEDSEKNDIEAVKSKTMTGTEYLINNCDMVLCREDISANALPFVDSYYDTKYMDDYGEYTKDKVLSTVFSWDDYEGFEPILDKAYREYSQ